MRFFISTSFLANGANSVIITDFNSECNTSILAWLSQDLEALQYSEYFCGISVLFPRLQYLPDKVFINLIGKRRI